MRLHSILLSLFILVSQPIIAVAAPVAHVDKTEFDFGEIAQGTKVSHEFILENKGEQDLIIHKVVAGCGCTAANVSQEPIAANSSRPITVTFDSTGFEGEKVRDVRVYTNDPKASILVLSMKGQIRNNYEITPKIINFGDFSKSSFAELQPIVVQVVNAKKNSSEPKEAVASAKQIKSLSPHIEVDSVDKIDGGLRARIILKDTIPPGRFRDRLLVNLEDGRSLNIPVIANAVGPVGISPQIVSFGIIQGIDPISRTLNIKISGKKPAKLSSVKVNHPAVSFLTKVEKEGFEYSVVFSLDPREIDRDFRGIAEIEFDEAFAPKTTVSLFGLLPPKTK